MTVDLFHRVAPARHTDGGLQALSNGRPIPLKNGKRYIAGKYGHSPEQVYEARLELGKSSAPSRPAERACNVYEKFR